MRIAIFHELHQGGALRAVNAFVSELQKNHTVDLYTTEKDLIPKKWKPGNWSIRLYKDTIELLKLKQIHKELAKKIDAKNYDLVFVHPSQFTQAPFILRFLQTKSFYYCEEPLRFVYELALQEKNKRISAKNLYEKSIRLIRKNIDKKNIFSADVILANSQFTKGNILKAYSLPSTVSYLGVDTKMFFPHKQKKKYDILYIGSRDEIDGFPLFEQSKPFFKRSPIIYNHITGEDWLSDEKDLRELYLQSKIVVCLAKNEPFGLIPLEAMACGVPVVAINEGGYKETVLDKKTGYLINRNPKILAAKCEYLLSHDKILLRMNKQVRKHVLKNWTWHMSVKEIEKIFNKYKEIK